MRRIQLVLLPILVFGFAIVLHAETQDFTVVNKTGSPIVHLFLSLADSNDWGEDYLGRDVLEDGKAADITFKGHEECMWDIRVTDKDENAWILQDVDLCTTGEVTFLPENQED